MTHLPTFPALPMKLIESHKGFSPRDLNLVIQEVVHSTKRVSLGYFYRRDLKC